jgi:hypothetical protein
MKAKLFGKKVSSAKKTSYTPTDKGKYEFHELPKNINSSVLSGVSNLEKYVITGVANCDLLNENGELLQKHSTGRKHFHYIGYLALHENDEPRSVIRQNLEEMKGSIPYKQLPRNLQNKFGFIFEEDLFDFNQFMMMYMARKGGNRQIADPIAEFFKSIYNIGSSFVSPSEPIYGPEEMWDGLVEKGKLVKKHLIRGKYRVSLEDGLISAGNKSSPQVLVNPSFILGDENQFETIEPKVLGDILSTFVYMGLSEIYPYIEKEISQVSNNLSAAGASLEAFEFLEKQFGIDTSGTKEHALICLEQILSGQSTENDYTAVNLPILERYNPVAAARIRKKLEEKE